ncbi:MAG TPA: cytochrome P450 [Marmoricola sp.]|nr:cytochrome P450 [Marmoricola sp.]
MALMQHQWDTYGPVAPLNMTGELGVMLLGPDAVGAVLQNRDKAFASGPGWSKVVGPFFTGGLMLTDFEEHHRHRRIMQEAFTRDRLARYTQAMQPAIEAGMAGWGDEPSFQSYWRTKQLALDIAAQIFMGGADDTTQEEMDRVNRAFIDCVQAASGIVRANVPFTRWGRAYRGRAVLEDFLRHYLPQKRAHETEDMFSVLCHIATEDGERFSDDDVINHMVFLMMAAHDTSTITTTTILRLLGQHPDWQQRCRQESLALGDLPSMEEIEGLRSIDLVMKEALRLHAPVPVLMRRTIKETVVEGVRIPADTDAVVAMQFSHTMDRYWTNPSDFDPERFTEERHEDRSHRFAWTPFGGGVHKCIGLYFGGLEVKSIVHRLLRTYEWHIPSTYVVPIDNHSSPFPKDGQPITLVRL